MIEKQIHYIWLGNKKIPDEIKKYMKHKRFIKAFMNLTKGYILRRIGVIGYTDSGIEK